MRLHRIDMKKLNQIERCIYSRNLKQANQLLFQVMDGLASNKYSDIYDCIENKFYSSYEAKVFCTRLTSALIAIASDEAYVLADEDYKTFCYQQGLIQSLFLASGYNNSAFLFQLIGQDDGANNTNINSLESVKKYYAFIPINFALEPLVELLPTLPPQVSFPYIMGSLINNHSTTQHGKSMREKLLGFGKFITTYPVTGNDIALVCKTWQRCCYEEAREKHHFRFFLNHLIRVWLGKRKELACDRGRSQKAKILVLFEEAAEDGAIFELPLLNSTIVNDNYHVMGMAEKRNAQPPFSNEFDETEYIDVNMNKLNVILSRIEKISPDVIIFPSVGKREWGIVLANTRLAPTQIIGTQFPYSTMSDCIDYVIDESGVGIDQNVFVEKVIPCSGDEIDTFFESLNERLIGAL